MLFPQKTHSQALASAMNYKMKTKQVPLNCRSLPRVFIKVVSTWKWQVFAICPFGWNWRDKRTSLRCRQWLSPLRHMSSRTPSTRLWLRLTCSSHSSILREAPNTSRLPNDAPISWCSWWGTFLTLRRSSLRVSCSHSPQFRCQV